MENSENKMNMEFAAKVLKIRHDHLAAFPAKEKVYQFVFELIELLFPHFSGEYEYFTKEEIYGQLSLLKRDLIKILRPLEANMEKSAAQVADLFFEQLPAIYDLLWLDARAIYEGDPASESVDEVITAYPGFFAIYTHRIAHIFFECKVPIFPRMLSEYAHYKSGVDIHPGADIGKSFFIDHGTGVVIGETTVIGDNVKIYQGVSLGALSVSKKFAHKKRHPTIEDNVVIYGNATILGGETVIGHDSVIGGNVWLTESVEPYSIVYNKFEVKVRPKKMNQAEIIFHI